MSASIRRVAYCSVIVDDKPGEAFRVLSQMAAGGVNLLAFHAVPLGVGKTQLVMFPEDIEDLAAVAQRESWALSPPQHAFLVQGEDRPGALADWHQRLAEHAINVVCTSGVADGRGGYACILYVRHEDVEAVDELLGAV
jgi:hypothetical protein